MSGLTFLLGVGAGVALSVVALLIVGKWFTPIPDGAFVSKHGPL
jgi:hypothetical protein